MYKVFGICLCVCVIIFAGNNKIYAGTIRGKVIDTANKEQLIGATVYIRELNKGTTTNLDGSYIFTNIQSGSYTLVCKFVGYETSIQSVKVTNEVTILNFYVKLNTNNINEVVIKGHNDQESNESARRSELNADNVINIMPAKTIDLSPDLTAASVLQRVSGVSLEGNENGNGQYAVIRGMDKRYNYTTVNDVKIPSPDNAARYVPMNIFPSELIGKLEVVKSLLPSMEGDAIGGAMNLVMKDAPDRFTCSFNVGEGMSQLFLNRSFLQFDNSTVSFKDPVELFGYARLGDFPVNNLIYHNVKAPVNSLYNFSIGNRFFHNKLGVIFAGSYHNTFGGANDFFVKANAQPDPINNFQYTDANYRQYSVENTSLGLHAKLDYEINSLNKIQFYTMYVQESQLQTRYIVDSAQHTAPGIGPVVLSYRSTTHDQSIYNSTLKGDHRINEHFRFNWTGAYSYAYSIMPDWAEFKYGHVVSKDSTGKQTQNAEKLDAMSRRWTHNSDQDLAGYLNALYNNKLLGMDYEIEVGGMYRHKYRDNYYNDFSLTPLVYEGYSNIHKTVYKLVDSLGQPKSQNTYTIAENVWAYYAQLKLKATKRLQILAGVRYEGTYDNYVTQQNPNLFPGAFGTIQYSDILPGVHLKYKLTKKQNLRLSYYASLSRPSYYEIIPYTLPGENYDETGNPYLKHTTADNYDLRYEFFPKGIDQILAGVFYKNITNPIEYGFIRPSGPSSYVLSPSNYGNAQNYGFEVVITKYVKNFGINANYTFTSSAITTSKVLYYEDSAKNQLQKTVNQTRPLQGQSKHIGNISLLYKSAKKGIDAQVSVVYTGRRIDQISPFYNLDYWQRATTTLSFSAEKTIVKRLSIYCKLNNLLNSPMIVEIVQPNIFQSGKREIPNQDKSSSITVQKAYTGQSYLLGLKFKFN